MKRDIDILARTLYGEAEPNNVADATAIAAVIVNRHRLLRWGNTIAKVCQQPWQFSCWNTNDPNRARIEAASGHWFDVCCGIAERAVDGVLTDPTGFSTHYYETGIRMPKWAKGKKPVFKVAHKRGTAHVFYNNIDTPAPTSARQALDQKKSLASTRTVKAQATVATGVTGLGTIDQLKEQLEPFAYWVQWAQYALLALAVAGILWTLWARFDDRRKGLR